MVPGKRLLRSVSAKEKQARQLRSLSETKPFSVEWPGMDRARCSLTLAGPIGFPHTLRPRGGGCRVRPPPRFSPNRARGERRRKSERVRRYETQRLVPLILTLAGTGGRGLMQPP